MPLMGHAAYAKEAARNGSPLREVASNLGVSINALQVDSCLQQSLACSIVLSAGTLLTPPV